MGAWFWWNSWALLYSDILGGAELQTSSRVHPSFILRRIQPNAVSIDGVDNNRHPTGAQNWTDEIPMSLVPRSIPRFASLYSPRSIPHNLGPLGCVHLASPVGALGLSRAPSVTKISSLQCRPQCEASRVASRHVSYVQAEILLSLLGKGERPTFLERIASRAHDRRHSIWREHQGIVELVYGNYCFLVRVQLLGSVRPDGSTMTTLQQCGVGAPCYRRMLQRAHLFSESVKRQIRPQGKHSCVSSGSGTLGKKDRMPAHHCT